MPVMPCMQDGQHGFKWGESGKCYCGPGAREKAIAMGRAIHANMQKQISPGELEKAAREFIPPDAGDAPDSVKQILSRVYASCRLERSADTQANKAFCAQVAWGAVHNAGYAKDEDGKWHKKEKK